ncbi:MAG: response regulator, partial [Verrucomicrobiota bacterium]
PGLLPGVEGQLFEPFFTTKEKGKGTGLGLSIAREIAHVHQGDLACRSTQGEGCVFTLTLPTSENHVRETDLQVDPVKKSRSAARPKLLIVDDEAPIRWMLKKLLHPMTEILFDAPDAEGGANFAEDHEFDVIISDFHLPGMDGIELYDQVRKPNLKQYVLITGDSSSPRIQQFSEKEDVIVLEKPFDLKKITALIEGACASGGSLPEPVALSS